MVTDMGDISTIHNNATVPNMTGTSVSEVMHHTPHPATTAAHATLQLMDTPIAIYTVTHPTGIVALHLTLTTAPADITHATIAWYGTGLTPATPTTLHG